MKCDTKSRPDLTRPGLYESPKEAPHTTVDVIVNTDLHCTHSQQSCTILGWLVRRTTLGARLTLIYAAQYPLGPSTNLLVLFHTLSLLSTLPLSHTHPCKTKSTLTKLLSESLAFQTCVENASRNIHTTSFHAGYITHSGIH